MTITLLKPYKGNTWELELDDSGELQFLHVQIVTRFQLRTGMKLTPEQWQTVQESELSRKAYQHACYLLDRRGYSYMEMFRKLEPKYPEQVCYAVTDRLASLGLINDQAYAEQTAHYYVEVKHFGLHRARQEMRRRGLLDSHITQALEPYARQLEENLRALVAGKYAACFADSKDRKQIEKGKAALVRRGYGFGEINRAVAWYQEQLEEE